MTGLFRSRLRRRSALVGTAVLLATAATTAVIANAPLAHAAADSAYVMGYFKESNTGAGNVNAVHLAVSKDALEWTPLNNNNAILTPTLGTRGIRDPFIFRLNNGSWVVMATDICNGCTFQTPNQNMHIWTSPDLVNWSGDRLLRLNTHNSFTWAPGVHWDPKRNQYGITFSTIPGGRTRPVIMVTYTSDFVTTSPPVVFFDGGNTGVIDSHVVTNVNGMNYLYFRDDATKSIAGARSATLEPGSFVRYTSGIKVSDCIEAPTLVKSLTSANWWLWGDNYCPNGRLYAWQGTPATPSWTRVNDNTYTAPLNSKHNTVATIESTTYNALLSRYGGTTQWNRLKSWNFPDRYVRHAANVGRIDAMPFDPYQDSQWKVVPGLADGAGVSFESVNFPGRFLRHAAFNVVLAQNNNTAVFRADATFYRVAGLANASWSSFRSYNFPTRYIRHAGDVLYVQEIAGAAAQADATFRVGY